MGKHHRERYGLTLAALVVISILMITGCAAKEPTEPIESEEPLKSEEPRKQETDIQGTPLFEMYKDKESLEFIEEFDPKAVVSASYYADEEETLQTENPEIILHLFNGLKEIRVGEEYKEDTFATDSGSGVSFKMENGKEFSVSFDFGNIYIEHTLYTCTNKNAFLDAVEEMREDQMEEPLFSMYEDEEIQEFAENFDAKKVEKLIYRDMDGVSYEIPEKWIIRRQFDNLAQSVVTGISEETRLDEAAMQSMEFMMKDGADVAIMFQFGHVLNFEIDGASYCCEYNYSLSDGLESLVDYCENKAAYLAFPENFDPLEVRELIYQYGREAAFRMTEPEYIEDIFEFLADIRSKPDRQDLSDKNRKYPGNIQFCMRDGSTVIVRFDETESELVVDVDGTLYKCEESGLQQYIEMQKKFVEAFQ